MVRQIVRNGVGRVPLGPGFCRVERTNPMSSLGRCGWCGDRGWLYSWRHKLGTGPDRTLHLPVAPAPLSYTFVSESHWVSSSQISKLLNIPHISLDTLHWRP